MIIDFKKIGDPVVIVSHPRSGTHLTIDLIRKQFLSCSSHKFPFEPQHYLYLSIEGFLDKKNTLTQEKAFKIASRAKRPIIKFHTYSYEALKEHYPEWMNWMELRGRFIFVFRDVREVLASYYVYSQMIVKNNVPFGQFIRQGYCGRKNRVDYWREMVETWESRPNVLMLDYEQILKNTKASINLIGKFIGEEPINEAPLLPRKMESIWQFRWDRIFSVIPESTAILGSKDGKKIDWRKELTPTDMEFVRENAGDVLKKYNPLF